ncbi:MAG: LytR family transcriptional regulator [Marmoricola sp.]|nr:LytR family transcriptional regulator [Marmoricola sp.]
MSEEEPRHRDRLPRKHKLARRILIGFCCLLVIASTAFFLAYEHLQGNIHSIAIGNHLGNRPKKIPVSGPQQPLTILVMGSDTRAGANGVGIGGQTPGLSDTTIMLHISANRKFAYGVSLPRDAMVQRPTCDKKGGGTDPGGLTQFNAAYAIGGPLCTVRTVEQLTGIHIDHFVVIDFVGFRNMVDAIHGVTVCIPEAINDPTGNINMPAGTYKVSGEQALNYVRERYGVGDGSDIGRMKRQQTFVAAMIKKVMSAGTLANPIRLYSFLDALTKSIALDSGFKSLGQLTSLGSSLKNIGLDNIKFITVPWQPYPPDINRVEWKPEAAQLWDRIKHDKPLGGRFDDDVVKASTTTPGTKSPGSGSKGTTTEQQAAIAHQNGLCS